MFRSPLWERAAGLLWCREMCPAWAKQDLGDDCPVLRDKVRGPRAQPSHHKELGVEVG